MFSIIFFLSDHYNRFTEYKIRVIPILYKCEVRKKKNHNSDQCFYKGECSALKNWNKHCVGLYF